MNKSKKKGISAIEVITTVSIVVLITVVVLPQFSKIKERQSLNNSA
jgi:Tfp pilus assembly protein FimT